MKKPFMSSKSSMKGFFTEDNLSLFHLLVLASANEQCASHNQKDDEEQRPNMQQPNHNGLQAFPTFVERHADVVKKAWTIGIDGFFVGEHFLCPSFVLVDRQRNRAKLDLV